MFKPMRSLPAAILLALVLGLAACDGDSAATISLVTLTVSPDGQIDPIGDTRQFTATATYDDSASADVTDQVTWSSSDTAVATIDASGLAKAVGGSYTTITASHAESGLSASVQYGVEYASEGTANSPKAIAVGTYVGQVGTGTSYYVVSGLNAGGNYSVFLSALNDDADLIIYDGDSSLNKPDCTFPRGRIADEDCSISSLFETDLFIVVTGADTVLGTSFEVTVIQLFPANAISCGQFYFNDGTADSPTNVPNPLRSRGFWGSSVATEASTSYYGVQVVNARSHRIALSSLAADVRLYVYSDAGFSNLIASHVTPGVQAVRVVDASPTSGTLYVKAQGAAAVNDCFTLSALPAEGSPADPVTILLEKPTPIVVDTTLSYYRMAVTADTTYAISISGTPSVGLTVSFHGSGGFSGTPLCTEVLGAETPTCPEVTPTGNTLYIKLDGSGSEIGGLIEISVSIPLPPVLPEPGP